MPDNLTLPHGFATWTSYAQWLARADWQMGLPAFRGRTHKIPASAMKAYRARWASLSRLAGGTKPARSKFIAKVGQVFESEWGEAVCTNDFGPKTALRFKFRLSAGWAYITRDKTIYLYQQELDPTEKPTLIRKRFEMFLKGDT